MRFIAPFVVAILATALPSAARADNAQACALASCKALFVDHDLEAFKQFVSPSAVQGDHEPGTALAKLEKQNAQKMNDIELAQIVFFRVSDIDRLEKEYPDDLWGRVRKHIGKQQGVLVKLALTGKLADRARAAGKDPRDIAMMTFVVNADDDPKIVHVDDN